MPFEIAQRYSAITDCDRPNVTIQPQVLPTNFRAPVQLAVISCCEFITSRWNNGSSNFIRHLKQYESVCVCVCSLFNTDIPHEAQSNRHVPQTFGEILIGVPKRLKV